MSQECPMGTHWSQHDKSCIKESNSLCSKAAERIIQCPRKGFALIPHHKTCQYFVKCQNGIQSIQRCKPYHYWDVYTKECVISTKAVCYTDWKKQF